jgi:transcriptional regulator of arginine metabolism
MKIIDIIEKEDIETQEDLAVSLKKHGMEVTQATVSRDIKELRLFKVLGKNSKYKYSLPKFQDDTAINDKFVRVFKDSLVSMDSAENIIVLKTLTGSAQGAAAAIDTLDWEEIVGTIAGDDTIMVIIRNKDKVPLVLERFNRLIE